MSSLIECCLRGCQGFVSNPQYMYVTSVVATYWVVSISLVYLNKVLVSNEAISIQAPLFVTWFQCIVTVIICWIAGKCGQRAVQANAAAYAPVRQGEQEEDFNENDPRQPPNNNNSSSFVEQFPMAHYDLAIGKRVFPLSIIFVGMIAFNILCLKYVQVSFYNVARSLTICFNVLLTKCMLGMPTSSKTMGCLTIVVIGFFLGSNGEVDFSLFGTIMGVCSSLFVSLNSILTKKMLPIVQHNHWRLTFYNNVNACFLFLPMLVVFEGHVLVDAISQDDSKLTTPVFWAAMLVAGVFGFSIGIVTVLQIKATSPLSHNISGTAKAAAQSIMAFYFFGNTPTVMGVLGIFVVLGGSLLYAIVKMNENNSTTQTTTNQQDDSEHNNFVDNDANPEEEGAEMARV